jgi:GntR family transcriptional regulator, transcriptional repressor for pyruvate dehydrogenase complex
MLRPLDRTTLATQASERIKDHILSNNLSPGDKLPAEWEFAKQMGVSVRVVREAMKSLETLGLVQTRAGAGRFVGAIDYSKLTSLIAFSVMNGPDKDLQHLAETRMLIELSALDLAIDRMSGETLDHLRHIVDDMRSATTVEETVDADHEFHRTLVEASGNPMLTKLLGFLDSYFVNVLGFVKTEAVGSNPEGHQSILDAVSNRDKALARELLSGSYYIHQPLTSLDSERG